MLIGPVILRNLTRHLISFKPDRLKVEEVLGTRKEFLFGTWTEHAKKLAEGDDDFTKDIYELNAKSLVTTWASYPQAESGGLKDYSNRQWAGLTQDFYKQRWTMWINQKRKN